MRSYEPVLIRLRSGEQHYGIIRDETPDSLRLASGPTTETKVPRSEVIAITEGSMSLMPPGFDGLLSPEELADLVAYLLTLR